MAVIPAKAGIQGSEAAVDDDEAEVKRVEDELGRLANELRLFRGRPVIDPMPEVAEPPLCSFCGKGKNQVKNLIQGPSVQICNECVELCGELIEGKP